MELLEGLMEYVDWEPYRKALGLPEKRTETYEPLAQGEYNRNYRFLHPITKKQLVLRINFGSQMHLEHQIEYEYHALKLLERSGRTPKAFYADGSLKKAAAWGFGDGISSWAGAGLPKGNGSGG